MGVILNFQKKINSSAVDKQIYQFPNKPSPALTDLLLLSDESSAHATKNCNFSQAANTILSVLPSGIYTPTFTILSNASLVTPIGAMYFGSSVSPGGIIFCFMNFQVSVTGDPVGINIKMPITSNFTNNKQIMGFSGTVHLTGVQAEGEIISFASNSLTDGGDLYFTTSAESGIHTLSLNFSYQIQV